MGSLTPIRHAEWRDQDDGAPIVIGLVNNMPDAAVQRTEGQFRELLAAGPLGQRVRLKLFFLPEVPRSDAIRSHFRLHYQDISQRADTWIDGLIVTGAEPKALKLEDEPYWSSLTWLVDWAAEHTASTVWSCLAAHAAVLHMDGIERHPFGSKLSGVFECRKVSDHPLLTDFPEQWRLPHSRYNGLPEAVLDGMGYLCLSASAEAGADVFVKQRQSLFVFLQGHPEYDAGALFREYRRDVGRFLSGHYDAFPASPRGYFDIETESALREFRRRAEQNPHRDLLQDLPAALSQGSFTQCWREPAALLFRNWLAYVMTCRSHAASTSPKDRNAVQASRAQSVPDEVPHFVANLVDVAQAGD